jgi:hypothetical protein
MQEEVATQEEVGVVIGLLQTDMGLRPPDTELRLPAMGLPQVAPLGTEQLLEECQRDTGRLHQVHQGEEALATQPRVTVMAAVAGEGHLLLMIPPSMFTNSRKPPVQEGPSMVGWRHCFHSEVSPFSLPSPSSPSSPSSPPPQLSLAASAGRFLGA